MRKTFKYLAGAALAILLIQLLLRYANVVPGLLDPKGFEIMMYAVIAAVGFAFASLVSKKIELTYKTAALSAVGIGFIYALLALLIPALDIMILPHAGPAPQLGMFYSNVYSVLYNIVIGTAYTAVFVAIGAFLHMFLHGRAVNSGGASHQTTRNR